MEADLIVSCPYDPTHRIRKCKLITHIAKCKKTSKTENKVECPLNKCHIVDRERLKEHIASCSSIGKLIDMDIGDIKPNIEPPAIVNSYDSTENWEEEPEVPSYNPMEISAKKPVIRCVSGLSKSEKRKFKENERMRMANLKGFQSPSAVSFSTGDTVVPGSSTIQVYEVPLRPPRDTTVSPTRILQNSFDNMQIYDDHTSTQVSSVHNEAHNNSFHRKLHDEAPQDDKQSGQSLRSINTDATISFKDYFQHVPRESGNFSDRNKETKVKETEINATSKLFSVNNMKEEKDECIASSRMSDEQVHNKLLALLKAKSRVKKIQSTEESVKINPINKDSGEKGPILDEIYNEFNERLVYLQSIQSTAAEESARLIKQLEELKQLRKEIALKK